MGKRMKILRVAWLVASLVPCAQCGGTVDSRDANRPGDLSIREIDAAVSDVPAVHAADVPQDMPEGTPDDAPIANGTWPADGRLDRASSESSFDATPSGSVELLGAPFVAIPTDKGFTISVVLRSGDPVRLRAQVRSDEREAWSDLAPPVIRAFDLAEWRVAGLDPGRRYEYRILGAGVAEAGGDHILYGGSAVTQKTQGASFTFDLLSDSHIEPCSAVPAGHDLCEDPEDGIARDEQTLLGVATDIIQDRPDFMVHLGDMLDYHRFGFNQPPPDAGWARLAYLNYRRSLGDASGNAAHFATIGNWEGESGCSGAEAVARSTGQRMLYVPGPLPAHYAEGGSPTEDYYAFTWGDALFVVLNVMTYTPTCHLLGDPVGAPDDWTLGTTQLAWLDSTLAKATTKWRFLFIHHTVGGNAGDDANSAYGRGGGRAAYVGEQATIHQMMLKYGVQVFFYGHDHVFTDMVVDGIHYTSPGSAGAPWKFDSSLTGYTQYWPDSGHGRVTVSPTDVRVDFVAVGGTTLSSYTIE
jgi:hypothetical protein